VQEQSRRHDDPRRVDRAATHRESDRRQSDDREHVQHPRCQQRAALTPSNRDRVQRVASIELDVLQCIQNVKSRDPRRHRNCEHAQHPPRACPRPRYGQITADGSDREPDPEHHVRPAREPLGEAVEENPRQRDRRKQKANVIQLERRKQEHTARYPDGDHRFCNAERAGRKLAHLRARVQSIDLTVGDPVESHRGEARGGKCNHDPAHLAHRHSRVIAREHHANQRERQREERVRKLYKVDISDDARDAVERLTLACGHNPSVLHIASTRAFVASSISILRGQFRVNPSSGNFRVASIPILEPYVNALLEWSSTSIGPIVKRVSRSGSMLFNATNHASKGLRTSTSLSTTTSTFASDMSPCPHIAFITLYAWPGYCLSIETNTRLWNIPSAGM